MKINAAARLKATMVEAGVNAWEAVHIAFPDADMGHVRKQVYFKPGFKDSFTTEEEVTDDDKWYLKDRGVQVDSVTKQGGKNKVSYTVLREY
jgi:hypothetical protein